MDMIHDYTNTQTKDIPNKQTANKPDQMKQSADTELDTDVVKTKQ